MHVLEYLHRNVKTVAMPSAMVAGALLCRPVTALEAWTHQMITPSLIFLMLFVTFCREPSGRTMVVFSSCPTRLRFTSAMYSFRKTSRSAISSGVSPSALALRASALMRAIFSCSIVGLLLH